MKFVRVLQRKLIVVVLVSMAVVGGATAFAATSDGESHGKNTLQATTTHHAEKSTQNTCPGLADAQQLATQFALSTASTSDDIQAVCALHQGTFTGTTPKGAAVASKRVFGYGEIDQLLTYAQFLAGQGAANAGGKLTSANARSFLAEAVQSCRTTPLVTCLQTHMPGFQPGNSNQSSHGKPSSTPAPHH